MGPGSFSTLSPFRGGTARWADQRSCGKFRLVKIAPTRAICLALVVFVCAISAQAQLFTSSCADDDHISPAKKATFDSEGMQFFNTLLGSDPGSAYDQLDEEAQKNVTRDQMRQISAVMLQPMKLEHLRVDHTYDATLTGSTDQRVVCGLLPDNQWVSVAARSGEQAHVLMSADFINGQYAFQVWLVPADGKWKVEGFWLGPSTLASYDAKKLWELARSERAKNHRFNATVLYATALQLTNRGKYLRLGLSNAISDDASSFTPSPEITGPPPYEWKDGSTVYKILSIGPIAIAGQLHIVINEEVGHWTDDKEVDGWNKNLRAYFKRTFPEYHEVFSSVIIRANEQGTHRGFGTVEEDKSSDK